MSAPADILRLDGDTTDGAMLITCRGELDLSVNHQLQEKVDQLWAEPLTTITIDTTRLSFMDSSGLRCLLRIRERCDKRGVRLEVIPSKPIARVLHLAGLEFMFDLSPPGRNGDAPRRRAEQPSRGGRLQLSYPPRGA